MSQPFYAITDIWPGQLVVLPRPRGNDWLNDDVRDWQRDGIDIVVSLLTPAEWRQLQLNDEKALCETAGIEFRTFPIPDMGVPASHDETAKLVHELDEQLLHGKIVGIHCRQGIGRSGMIAASLLIARGYSPNDAFERVTEARGCSVPETVEQRDWIETFAEGLRAAAVKNP